MRTVAMQAVVGLAVVGLAAGCVSNKKFEGSVADLNGRVDGVQATTEEHGEAIDELQQQSSALQSEVNAMGSKVDSVRGTSEEAMKTAKEAKAAAKGKVLWKVTLTNNDVKFGLDAATVTEQGASALNSLVDRLKQYDKMVFVEIQGHTDATGNEDYNRQLGYKRAEQVRGYLHEKGIPLNLMSVISYGEGRPIADNSTREGRAANRRVEILVLE